MTKQAEYTTEFAPATIEEAAQISAACSLVGIDLTYQGGRGAVGSLDGRLQESRFAASFPDRAKLAAEVCDAISAMQKAQRKHENEGQRLAAGTRSASVFDSYHNRGPEGVPQVSPMEKAEQQLRDALLSSYGIH